MFNPYLPYPVRIKDVIVESEDKSLRTFRLSFLNPDHAKAFVPNPGQFAELSIAGAGEIPIGIASSPTEGPDLLFTVSRAGSVSSRLHEMRPGEVMGVRGPLGNGFPLDQLRGKNVVIVAGGFAVTTLRAVMVYLTHPDNRPHFGDITFIYGARTPGMLLYKDQLADWQSRPDLKCHVTVDREAPGWKGIVGFVPAVTEKAAPKPDNAIALVCGPPVMIRFTQPILDKLRWKADQIYLSLENRMKCGIGTCGRCNVGPKYVCKDGPVFLKSTLDKLPKEY